MMEPRGAALRTGVFVLAGLAALIGLIFVLSGNPFDRGEAYESYFKESVQGLDVGSPVKFRGVTIGRVIDIGLVSAEYPPENSADLISPVYQQVIVRFRVGSKKLGPHPNVVRAIRHGLRVQVAPQGITGLAYLELSFVDPKLHPEQTVPWSPRSEVIPSIPSTLTQVSDAIQGFLENARKIDLSKTIDQLTDLIKVLDQEMTSGSMKQTIIRADDLLGELQTQVREANLPATTASLRTLADGAQTRTILQRLRRTSEALAKASAALPALIAETRTTVRTANAATISLNRQMIPILHSLNAASRNLMELSAELKSNPAVVLRGSPPPRQTR